MIHCHECKTEVQADAKRCYVFNHPFCGPCWDRLLPPDPEEFARLMDEALKPPQPEPTCSECGQTPMGEACYRICPNSVHYYSPEQERADDANYDPTEYYREGGFGDPEYYTEPTYGLGWPD